MAVRVAMTLGLAVVAAAQARTTHGFVQQQLGAITRTEPAAVLVMPFDVTSGHVSFEIVSRLGRSSDGLPLRTHWVYWSADCRHLANVIIELTELDTVVVDPTHLQGQIQSVDPLENHPQGPVVDLTGERGIVIVSILGAEPGSPQLVGGWTIAGVASGASLGGDAVGLVDGSLPDASFLDGGLRIPTFDPTTLTHSDVILIGLESDGGEIRPITRPSAALGDAHVCCAASVTDNMELKVSIPDVCFDCVAFTAITPELAADGMSALTPPNVVLGSAGFVELTDCRSAASGDTVAPIGDETPQFIVAFHGQSVGPFGFVVTGKYSGFASPI